MFRAFASLAILVALTAAAIPRAHDAQAAVRAAFATLDAFTASPVPGAAHVARPAAPARWIPVSDYARDLAARHRADP